MAAQTGQKVFGAGRFYGIPVQTTPTVSPGLVVQDMTLTFQRDVKKLFGLNQLPVDIAAGMLSVSGKANLGGIAGRFLNDLMIGGTLSTGQVPNIANESLSLSAGSTATLNPANTPSLDLGLFGSTDGVPLVRVTTGVALTAGQYSFSSTGGYAFSSLEARTAVKVSYLYSTVNGQTVTMSNQPMGKTGNFEAVMTFLWGTDKGTIQLPNCMASNYELGTKLDDYMRPAFAFEAGTDSSDSLGTFSYAELS